MPLQRAAVIFVMANLLLAWLGFAGLGGPTEVTTAAAGTVIELPASAPYIAATP